MHPPFYSPVDPRAKPDPIPQDVRTIIKPYRLTGPAFDVPIVSPDPALRVAHGVDWTQDPRFVPAPKGPGLKARLGRALIRAGRALGGDSCGESVVEAGQRQG